MEIARATVVGSEIEAEMLCALLRTANIRCFHRKTDFGVGAIDAAMSSGFGSTEILVAVSDLERAREVLESGDGTSG